MTDPEKSSGSGPLQGPTVFTTKPPAREGNRVTVAYRTGDGVADPMVLRWSHHPRCVGLARSELRKVLRVWGWSRLEDAAVLVLSELFTTALRQAKILTIGEIETRYVRVGHALRLEVHNAVEEPRQPIADVPDLQRVCRVRLLNVLADRWGEQCAGPGRTGWAELDLPSRIGARHAG